MAERTPLPSPAGMDRNSDAYRAAVQAAVADAPPLDAMARTTLRSIFTAAPAAPALSEPLAVAS